MYCHRAIPATVAGRALFGIVGKKKLFISVSVPYNRKDFLMNSYI
jgi:hypothetical protein